MVRDKVRAPLHTKTVVSGDFVVGLERRPLRLTVVKGPDRRLRADISSERILIGSHEQCDLCLTDATVSRQHCELVLTRAGYVIRDLGSTNGTYVDDLRIIEAVLEGGATIAVGSSHVKLSPLSETVELSLPAETRFGRLLGVSPEMRQVFDVLAKVAPSESTVLIGGESGTGKELAARSIHDHSARRDGPFVVVDCGGLPAALAESALYGHKKGAFTGATRDHTGAFESANGGTVFLDEIGELPLSVQTRLLGVLQRREIQPVGSTQARPIDARVIAATHRDLRKEINGGGFREDLFFRLAVVTIEMPPLRERPEDIPLYIDAILAELGDKHALDAATIEALSRRSWPGNVRELRNVLERALTIGDVETDERAGSLAVTGVDAGVPFKVGKAELVEQFERAYVEQLMRRHDKNITHAARAAQIDRVYLLRLLDKFGLRPRPAEKAKARH